MGSALHQLCPRYSGTLTSTAPTDIRLWETLTFTFFNTYPADIWCENDAVLTSMRRDHVASTLIQRHFGTKCPLGKHIVSEKESAGLSPD